MRRMLEASAAPAKVSNRVGAGDCVTLSDLWHTTLRTGVQACRGYSRVDETKVYMWLRADRGCRSFFLSCTWGASLIPVHHLYVLSCMCVCAWISRARGRKKRAHAGASH